MEMKIRFHDNISLAVTDVVPDLPGLHHGEEMGEDATSFTSKPETGFSQEPHRGCGM